MNIKHFYTKQAPVIILILFTGVCSLAQSPFNTLIKNAYNSSVDKNYTTALKILDSAKALNGIDPSYNESIKYWYGIYFQSLNNIDSAITYYDDALKYFEQINDTDRLADIHNRLGGINESYLHLYTKAMLHYAKAKKYYELLNDKEGTLSCIYGLATSYKMIPKYAEAKKMYLLIIKTIPIINVNIFNISLLGVADVYKHLAKIDSAMYYYDKCIANLLIVKDSVNLFFAYNNKGDCFLQLKNYKAGLNQLLQAQKNVTPAINIINKKELYNNLSICYNQFGDYKKAYYYKALESTLTDSLHIQNIANATAEMDAKYDVRKKQDSLLISKQNLKIAVDETKVSHRNLLISFIVLAGIGLLAFLSFRNARIKRKANKILTEQKNEVQQLANKLHESNQTKTKLFSTISHDLRSPISSLYASLKMQEINGGDSSNSTMSEQTIVLLDTLEDLLVWSKSQMDRFNPSPVKVNLYYLLNNLSEFYKPNAMVKNITIANISSASTTLLVDENILKTILRNIISNAINNAPNNSTIYLTSVETNNTVECCIKNKCTSEKFELLKNSFSNCSIQSNNKGLGLVLVKEFLEKINGKILINYLDEQASISIIIPQHQ